MASEAAKDDEELRCYLQALSPIVTADADFRQEARTNGARSVNEVLATCLAADLTNEIAANDFGRATNTLHSAALLAHVDGKHTQAVEAICRCVYWSESGIAHASNGWGKATREYGGASPGLLGVTCMTSKRGSFP